MPVNIAKSKASSKKPHKQNTFYDYRQIIWITLLMSIILLMPYKFLGDGFGNILITFWGLIFLLKHRNKVALNKNYLTLLFIMFTFSLISLLFTNNLNKSLIGIPFYINAILFYLIFVYLMDYKEKIINIIIYLLSISATFFILYQGIILSSRISGNIGYANTYALLLIIGLYLNEIRKNDKFSFFFQIILTAGVIFTGSRNSFLYLLLFFIIKTYHDFSKIDKFSGLMNFILALLIYIICKVAGPIIILLLPLILLLCYILNNVPVKAKNYLVLIICILGVSSVLLINTNSINRIKNLSWSSGVFQERLVFYQDAAKHIIKHPLGSGINSFEYRQYKDQTAFYDVRYIHNSFLQTGYDLGVLPMIIFLIIMIYGASLIVRSKEKDKIYFLSLYLTIYLHSLLDFDFAYTTIEIIVVMIIAWANNNQKNNSLDIKPRLYITLPVLTFSLYLILYVSILAMGDNYAKSKQFAKARLWYGINNTISLKNPEIHSRIAQSYIAESRSLGDKDYIISSIAHLKQGAKINPDDPKIIGNIAFAYEDLGNNDEAIKYYNKLIQQEKFYYKFYQFYYVFLEKKYQATNNLAYLSEIDNLKETYNNNFKLLNPKAKYMNNQLTKSFDEMLKLK